MPREVFMVPMIGTGTRTDPFRAKYSNDAAVTAAGALRSAMQDECLLMLDATQVYLDSVAAQPDAMRIATTANIDSPLTQQQADGAAAFLESRTIPGEFVEAGETRRAAIRGIAGLFLFCQRCEGRFGVGFKKRAVELGVTFATQYNAFPQALKDMFVATCQSEGWDVPPFGLTPSSTLRQILVALADGYAGKPLFIGGVSI